MTTTEQMLRDLLVQALHPSRLTLRDDSAVHAGHAGAREGAHFHAHVVADCFSGLRTLERHRLVYQAAASLVGTRIHALQLHTETPSEAQPRNFLPEGPSQ
jgi:BolA family transcriptional regulator, general stress-responsive regulator